MSTEMKFLIGFLALTVADPVAAQTTGASFLRIDTGARPAAMGGAYTAISDDVNALTYNPGGLPLLNKREFGATHSEWLLGSRFDFLGYGHPTTLGTFGIGLTRLSNGDIQGRSADRNTTGSFEVSDTAYAFGFGRGLNGLFPGGRTGVGGSVKYVESRIGPDSASTIALDVGLIHRFNTQPLSLGFSVLNLGRGIRFVDQTDPLPLTVSAGAAYRLAGAFGITLDVRHEAYDRRTVVGAGTEYTVLSSFSVRAGYASLGSDGPGSTPLSGMGGGFGLRLGSYRADYTITPFGSGLGNAQRFSLAVRF